MSSLYKIQVFAFIILLNCFPDMNYYKILHNFLFFLLKGGVNVPSYPGPPGPPVSSDVYHHAQFSKTVPRENGKNPKSTSNI